MGLFLDVIIIFLVRLMTYRWKLHKGDSWPIVDAIVTESEVQREYAGWNLHLAFRYANSQGKFGHIDHYIPYWYKASAEQEWKRFRPDMPVRIRVNPSNEEQVIVDGSSLTV